MDYFKKCPKCGVYMMPYIQFKFGYAYTFWICCSCGHSESVGKTGYDTRISYTGGGASDRTVIK